MIISLFAYILINNLCSALNTPPSGALHHLANIDPVSGEMEDLEFRFTIEPGRLDCFYQNAKPNHNLEVSYQVIEMSNRFQWLYSANSAQEMFINFFIKDPNDKIIFQDYKKQDGYHSEKVTKAGVYTLCFDNEITSTSTKLINLEVYLYSDEDNDRWFMDQTLTFSPEIQYLDTVESLKASINKVRDDLIKIVHNQDERRAIEKRDRNIVEHNLKFINNFSFVSTVLMIIVGIIQIVTIKIPAEFKEKNRDQSVKRGSPVKLTCMAEGDLPMTITWSKDSNTFEKWASNHYEIFENEVKDGFKSELLIRNAEKSDAGKYICQAENEFGKDERKNQLHVVEVPTAPVKVRTKKTWARQAIIEWDPPSVYRSSILGYVIRYWKIEKSHKFDEVNTTHLTSYTLESLDPGYEYGVTVSAYNEVGRGFPSEIFRFHTSEEPPSGVPLDVTADPRGPTTIRVTWKAPPRETWNGQLTGYEIGYKVYGSTDYPSYSYKTMYHPSHNDTIEFLLNLLLKETEYSIVVRARNRIGVGPLSQVINVATLSADLPLAPTVKILATNYDSVTLGYIVNRKLPASIKGLGIHYRSKSEFEWEYLSIAVQDSKEEGEYTLVGLEENTYYQLYLTAIGEKGNSDPSKIVTIRTVRRSGYSGIEADSTGSLDYLVSDAITMLSITSAVVIVVIVTIVAFVCVRIAKLKASKPNFDFCGTTLSDGYDKGTMHVGPIQRYNEPAGKTLLQGNTGLNDDFSATQYPIPYSTLPMNPEKNWNQASVTSGSVSKVKNNDGRHVYDCPQ